MKNKKFFKKLLSLALAVIITASVCVCGFSVAAETEIATVNLFDGTVAAPYVSGVLNASAGITDVIEGQSVACLVPESAYDARIQIGIGSRPLEEGEIDLETFKTLYLYINNDLGDDIQWRISEHATTNSSLGTAYHNNTFSDGTEYYMVDSSNNTAKKYSYTQNSFIYIPKDFNGYIAFDLATCDSEILAEFFACNLEHLFFWVEGLTEKTVGNSFYYGDMNLTTEVAEDVIFDKANIDYMENVCLNPLTDTWANEKKSRYIYSTTPHYVNNEYIGQSLYFTGSSGPVIKADLFTVDDNSYNYNAIIFKLKLPAGAAFPKFKIAQSKSKNLGWAYAHIKGDWTTINLINGEVAEYSKKQPANVIAGEEGFEGYLIFHLNENLTIPVPSDDIAGTELTSTTLKWTQFLDLYYGYTVNMRLALTDYVINGTTPLNLGEISVVEDVDSFIYNNTLSNENVVFDPYVNKPGTASNATYELVETNNIGSAYQYTVTSSEKGVVANLKSITINSDLANCEAFVFKVKTKNGVVMPDYSLGKYGYITTKYITVNTLTGEIVYSDEATRTAPSATGGEFEGYIIAPTDKMTIYADVADAAAAHYDYLEYLTVRDGDSPAFNIRRDNAASAQRFKNWQIGEVSLVDDLDAYIETITKPTNEGDANLDGESDVRDLITMKKAVAGIKDIKINAFNVKLDNSGSAIAGSDLIAIRKKLMNIEENEPTDNEEYSILFVGNSYTYYNDMPTAIFKSLAKAHGVKVNVTAITYGGHTLTEHANPADSCGKQIEAELTGDKKYDFVVLQESSVVPADAGRPKFYSAVRNLCDRIIKAGAQPILYSTWGRKTGSETLEKYGWTNEEMTYKVAAAYTAIGDELKIPVAYAGLAFFDVYTNQSIELYDEDMTHPSYRGSFLAAATIFAKIFNTEVKPQFYSGKLSESTAEILCNAANKAALNEPIIPEEYKTSSVGVGE